MSAQRQRKRLGPVQLRVLDDLWMPPERTAAIPRNWSVRDPRKLRRTLRSLEDRGFVECNDFGGWSITSAGEAYLNQIGCEV